MENLEKKVDMIIENHLVHLKEDISTLKSDVDWLKKFQWLILATAIGSLVVNILR